MPRCVWQLVSTYAFASSPLILSDGTPLVDAPWCAINPWDSLLCISDELIFERLWRVPFGIIACVDGMTIGGGKGELFSPGEWPDPPEEVLGKMLYTNGEPDYRFGDTFDASAPPIDRLLLPSDIRALLGAGPVQDSPLGCGPYTISPRLPDR